LKLPLGPASWATLAAVVAIAASCHDAAAPSLVAAVVVASDSTTIVVGARTQLSASVRDANGNPIGGQGVVWSTLDGNTVTLSASGVVTGLSPGRALITATSGGRTATTFVRVIAPLDYAIVGAQFTQAIQSTDGSIPMVLGGNGAAVNVLMSSNASRVAPMQLVLRLFDATGSLVRADTMQFNLPPGPAPSYESPSAQFLLPASALAPGLRWQLLRDPGHLARDSVPANDAFPRLGPTPLPTVAVPPLRVRFVPILLTAYGDVVGNVTAANVQQYVRMLESVYPVGTIEASVGPPLSTPLSFGTPPRGGDATQFWTPLLTELDAGRLTSGDPTTHWIGVVLPPPAFNHIVNGGVAYIPSSGLSSAAGTRTAMVTSLGWASDDAFTRDGVAHELGHNFGRRHAPCGSPENPDPSYPYVGGAIGLPGHDVRAWMDGLWLTAVSHPSASGDIMSYCTPMWVSDYTYRAVLAFRGTVAAARSAIVSSEAALPVRVLLVRGTVVDGREVTLAPAFTLDARPSRPEQAGSYRLEGRAADGRVLFAYDFAPSAIDHAPGVGHFAFAIPVTADVESSLATIEVRGPAGSARIDRPIVLAGLRTATAAELQPSGDGAVSVACADAGARGILVRDENSGALLGTASGASARVVAVAGTALTIVCSDGIRSSTTRVIAR
jgi:hypothetical protein